MEVSFDLIQYMKVNKLHLDNLYEITSTGYIELDKELLAVKKHRPSSIESSVFATILIDCYGAYIHKDYESYLLLVNELCTKRLGNISEVLNEFDELFKISTLGFREPLSVKANNTGKYFNHTFNKVCDSENNLIETTTFGKDMQKVFRNKLKENHRYLLNNSLFIVESGNIIGEQYQLACDYTCGIMSVRPLISSNNLRYYRLEDLTDLGEDLHYNFFNESKFLDLLFTLNKSDFVKEITDVIKNKNINTFYFRHVPPKATKEITYSREKYPITIFTILKSFILKIADNNKLVHDFLLNKELTSSVILQALNIYLM